MLYSFIHDLKIRSETSAMPTGHHSRGVAPSLIRPPQKRLGTPPIHLQPIKGPSETHHVCTPIRIIHPAQRETRLGKWTPRPHRVTHPHLYRPCRGPLWQSGYRSLSLPASMGKTPLASHHAHRTGHGHLYLHPLSRHHLSSLRQIKETLLAPRVPIKRRRPRQ